jgi:hypothetical protein
MVMLKQHPVALRLIAILSTLVSMILAAGAGTHW